LLHRRNAFDTGTSCNVANVTGVVATAGGHSTEMGVAGGYPDVRGGATLRPNYFRTLGLIIAGIIPLMALAGSFVVFAEHDGEHSRPGNLVLSRSVYNNDKDNITVGTILPPNCASTAAGCPKKGGKATNDGSLPLVWNNNLADGSFGITSKIFLDQITPSGRFINTLEVPNSAQPGVSSSDDQMVTSFSSKSEIALNLSTDRQRVTFMGQLQYHGARSSPRQDRQGHELPRADDFR
jgi:hypothetical protein